jgi:hypothetical protein
MRISQPKPIAIWSPNRNTSSQTVSPRRLAVLEHSKQRSNEGKDPLLSEATAQQKRPNLKGSSQAVHLKDPIVQQGIVLSPKQKMPLIRPKDEPFTDDVPFDNAPQPIAIIRPGKLIQSLGQRNRGVLFVTINDEVFFLSLSFYFEYQNCN